MHGSNGGAVSAKVERTVAIANTQHGIAVYDDTDDTFEADLGGGNLGSAGLNVLAGNTLEDLAVDYDGRTLSAMNNWWGQVAGPDTDDPSVGIAPQIYYGAPINDGLVGHWTFDREWTSNTTAYDRSGNGNDGTLMGGLTLADQATGQNREALDFDADDYTIRAAPSFFPMIASEPRSYFLWFKKLGNGASFPRLISSGPAGAGLEFAVTADGSINYFDGVWTDTGLDAADNTFENLSLTFDGSQIDVYLNDGLPFSRASGGRQNNTAMAIGIRETTLNEGAEGIFDDVRIYSRALDPTEIAELYRMDASSAVDTSGFLTADPR